MDPQAVALSVLASMTTSLGAALVFLVKETSHRTRDALVGLSAGLMLSVTALNLLPKALGPNDQNLLQVVIGIALGATALFAADKYMPHIHGFLAPDRPITKGMKMTLMLVTALVIHNFPEGFATGTAYAGGVTVFGNTVALGIALQNVQIGRAHV